jgi:hypothetical protein
MFLCFFHYSFALRLLSYLRLRHDRLVRIYTREQMCREYSYSALNLLHLGIGIEGDNNQLLKTSKQ